MVQTKYDAALTLCTQSIVCIHLGFLQRNPILDFANLNILSSPNYRKTNEIMGRKPNNTMVITKLDSILVKDTPTACPDQMVMSTELCLVDDLEPHLK